MRNEIIWTWVFKSTTEENRIFVYKETAGSIPRRITTLRYNNFNFSLMIQKKTSISRDIFNKLDG